MPTGYTASVGDGEVTEFRDFALTCARNFGACFHQRDDNQKDLPKLQEVSDYHLTAKNEYVLYLKNLKRLSDKSYIERYKVKFFNDQLHVRENIQDKINTKLNYEKMLEAVKNWTPPTPDHDNMKNFMISQLTESIDWDCDLDYYNRELERQPLSDEDILIAKAEEIERLERDIEYHTNKYKEEVERINKSNEWILELYKSLE